jgi:flagellar protein FliS
MKPTDRYLKTRIMTASPGELIVMLYDGIIKRVRLARRHAEAGDWLPAGEPIGRAQDILHELMACLKPEEQPELADRLMALYVYCVECLGTAIRDRDTSKILEVDQLLVPLREAWAAAEKSVKNGTADEQADYKRATNG